MALGNVVVFGAATEPGAELCRLLRADGRDVVAVSTGAGDISALAPLDLEIRTLDATQAIAVKSAVNGISPSETFVSFLSQEGAGNIIDAAVAAGVRRFVQVTSIGGGESAKALSLIKRIAQRKKLKQITRTENHLRGSKLSWTIIRPGPYGGRKPSGNGVLLENPLATGTINAKDMSRIVYNVLNADKTVGKAFSAVDARRAKISDGTPVTPFQIK